MVRMGVQVELDVEWEDRPEFEITAGEKFMLDMVIAGSTPENASIAAGIGDAWRHNNEFAAYINRVHAFNIAVVEQETFKLMKRGKTMPQGHQFWLKAVAGWHDKWGEDGFAQEIKIEYNVVDGKKPSDDAA